MTGNDPDAAGAGINSTWAPADPPSGPEPVPPTTVVAGMVAVMGLAAVDVATGGLISGLLDGFPAKPSPGPAVLPSILEGTSAPVVHRDGTVECSRCHAAAAYATMTLNEHGYFCPRCGPSQPALGAQWARG
jgi:hypothetical protein